MFMIFQNIHNVGQMRIARWLFFCLVDALELAGSLSQGRLKFLQKAVHPGFGVLQSPLHVSNVSIFNCTKKI